ncbi:hypothetical protein GF378_02460 [Candidatus Pacearchaeota archaeon]|nr:hypothetical protein [Candidatus Pacearchaeota archaeon]
MTKRDIKKQIALRIWIILLMAFLLIVLVSGLASAYRRSSPQFSSYQGPEIFGADASSLEFDDEMCQQGQDFVIQIAPFGCEPAVVRDDLLEEQNVPVFCKLAATKINPLIDVDAIDSMSITGKLPQEIAGIGYQPARAALGTKERISSPILDNVGYAVIVLRKQPNASAIPETVEGNLTAEIKYDVKNAFGVGKASYYLDEVSDENWESEKVKYSFWNGRGFLRAEDITNTDAVISVYDDNKKLQTFTLEKGETSGEIFLPGFACFANLRLKLFDLGNPDTRAVLRINDNYVEVKRGESFLEDKCTVEEITKAGLRKSVRLRCREDDTNGYDSSVKTFELSINPKVRLDINGEKQVIAEVGDHLFDQTDVTRSDIKFPTSYYLGYAGTKKGTGKEEDLDVVIVGMPMKNKVDRLSDKDLRFVKSFVGSAYETEKEVEKSTLLNLVKKMGRFFAGTTNYLYQHISENKQIQIISKGDTKGIGRDNIKLIGFAGIVDESFESEAVENNYSRAVEDYETIIELYSDEDVKGKGYTYGEKAFESLIRLQEELNQKDTVLETCGKFKQRFPESKLYEQLVKDNKCQRSAILSSSETSTSWSFINGKNRKISFIDVYEPSEEEFGAEILMMNPDGSTDTFFLGKDEIWGNEEGAYMQLVDLTDNSAKVKVSLNREWLLGDREATKARVREFFIETRTLRKGQSENFGSQYSFTLQNVKLEKSANVAVVPNINNVGSKTNFSFKIGIEKRSIQLSPDKTKEIIRTLNDTIERWSEISDKIGDLTQKLEKTCLVVGSALIIKNFFANIGGKGIARQKVMRGPGGWNEKCATALETKKLEGEPVNYVSVNDCLTENANKIENQVNSYAEGIEEQNEKIKRIQEGIAKKEGLFGEEVVNTEELKERYVDSEYKSNLKTSLKRKFGDTMTVGDKEVSIDTFVEDLNASSMTIDEIKSLELNAQISGEGLDSLTKNELESEISTIYTETSEKKALGEAASKSKEKLGNVPWTLGKHEAAKYEVYEGYKVKEGEELGEIKTGMEVQGYRYKGENFYLELQDPETDVSKGTKYYGVANVYDENGQPIDLSGEELNKIQKKANEVRNNVIFNKYDSGSYKNKFLNPEVRYFTSGANEELPAIVPFDIRHGWYAATRQTLPVGSNIRSYDKSGRVNSFYLCNVGENNLQEFHSDSADDICQMINLATGQPYNQFPGLSETEAKEKVREAVNAIEEASRKYESGMTGQMKIAGNVLDIGAPAANIPGMQCQDFMSPRDCQIMFNLCDPVICPSSRCDLGGKYPVKDVVQTGVFGGVFLCLPNFREGIWIPFCLKGIHAGLESWIGVLDEYRGCLQESLETGQMIGICDEIFSIHFCDIFMRQVGPIAEIGVQKLVAGLFGKTTARGGGEYLSVQDAWNRGKKSFDYFTSYYAASSFSAFKARTTQEIGSLFCKTYISGVAPQTGNLLDQLTEPESPPQFHGRIDIVPFTSATTPPQSQYKVFYYIFAGQGSRAYYKVYLRSKAGGSYYKDVGGTRIVAQGYIPEGDTESETIDFTAPTGYTELCISVNGQEECGFKSVSTDFAVDYASSKYKQQQIEERNIRTESACISGTPSAYSLLTPSAGGMAEELIDPAIYNKGITRICATENPGKGSDPQINTEKQRWIEVGYCGNQNMKCWLDTSTAEDVIENPVVANETLSQLTENSIKILEDSGTFIPPAQFDAEYDEIFWTFNPFDKITKISKTLNKVYLQTHKARLRLLRGDTYAELALGVYQENQADRVVKETKETLEEEERAAIATKRCSACGEGAQFCDEEECMTISRNLEEEGLEGCVFLERNLLRGLTDAFHNCFSKTVWINETRYLDRVMPLLEQGADIMIDVGTIDPEKYQDMGLAKINNFDGLLRINGDVTGGEV